MARIIALDILKAAPQHAQDLGTTGLAMLLAITTRWDSLGGTVSVKWSNRTMSDYSGLSRNTVPATRDRLVRLGWLTYQQEGLHAGRYTPHVPSYHVQASVADLTRLHEIEPSTVPSLSQALGSYIPSPIPSPDPSPAKVAKAPAQKSEADILLNQNPFKISGPKRTLKPTVNELIKRLGIDKAGKFLASLDEPLWPDRLMAAANRWIEPTPQANYGQAPKMNLDL